MQNPITIAIDYVKSSIAELKKVTWPTRDQTIRYSALVISVSVAVAAFFASLDLGFSRGILYAISKTPHSSAPTNEVAPIMPDLVPTPEVEATPQGNQGGTVNVTNPEATTEPTTLTQPPTQELPAETPIELPKN